MNIRKTLMLGLFAVMALVLTAAPAEALIPPTPYTGVNTIGTVWQEQRFAAVHGFTGYHSQYNYPYPARAGGFYGDTTAFIHGLRPGVYAPVAPVHYTRYYQPACTWPYCHLGGAGFPRRSVSQGPIVISPGI